MNIQTAIRQMRIGRKLGKINNEIQSRIMRRLAPRESQLHWEALMRLRASIEKEIAPKLAALRQAEEECFQIRFATPRRAAAVTVTAKVRKPKLTGYEYTPQWWKEAELRERTARKAGELVEV